MTSHVERALGRSGGTLTTWVQSGDLPVLDGYKGNASLACIATAKYLNETRPKARCSKTLKLGNATFVTVGEACCLCGIDPSAIYDHARRQMAGKEPDFPTCIKAGTRFYIDLEAFQTWTRKQGMTAMTWDTIKVVWPETESPEPEALAPVEAPAPSENGHSDLDGIVRQLSEDRDVIELSDLLTMANRLLEAASRFESLYRDRLIESSKETRQW